MNLLRDLRYGVRILTRNRLFALAALAVIALGIGATTAVFSVVRAVLFRPLPYSQPAALVALRADSGRGTQQPGLSTQEFVALRERTDLFDTLATIVGVDANLTGVDDMELVPAASFSDDLFGTLGVSSALGRLPSSQDDVRSQFVATIAISYELWQRRWQGDPSIIGRRIEVNNFVTTVAAVIPKGFELNFGPGVSVPRHVDVWFPNDTRNDTPTAIQHAAIGRLRRGVTVRAAQNAINILATRFVADHLGDYKTGPLRLTVVPLIDDVVRDVKPGLVALAGAVAFVLLVACANLTNLLLARACSRTREFAIRTAVGASRAHVIRQLTIESLLLAAIGGAAGVLLASWGVDILTRLAPAAVPRINAVRIDGTVVLFAAGVSVAASLVFGLVPAWQTTRTDIVGTLKHDPAARSSVTRGLLVASQLALSLILLVGAGLMMRTFIRTRAISPGYDAPRILTMSTQLAFRQFRTSEDRQAFYQRAVAAVKALPGVASASLVSPLPLADYVTYRRVAIGPDAPEIVTYQPTVFPDYFRTMGIRLRDGREFTATDAVTPQGMPIIIDHMLAGQLWPGLRAVGRRLLLSPHPTTEQWGDIVGVVDHVRAQDLHAEGLPQIYVSYLHRPSVTMAMVVRTQGDPRRLAASVKQTVERLRPGRPSHQARPLQESVDAQRAGSEFIFAVLAAFAGLALILTALGLYGVVAYSTARRTREIAVRRALGASARGVVTLVVREGAGWICLGLAAGALGARGLSRSLESLLFEVRPTDAATFILVALLLTIVALVAAVIPAISAVRVDPLLALRSE